MRTNPGDAGGGGAADHDPVIPAAGSGDAATGAAGTGDAAGDTADGRVGDTASAGTAADAVNRGAGSSDDSEVSVDASDCVVTASDNSDVAAGDGDTAAGKNVADAAGAAADGEAAAGASGDGDIAAGDDAEAAAVEVVDGVSREALGRARRARILQQFTDSELLLAAHDFAVVNPGDGFDNGDPLADRSIQLAGDGATGVSESGITWFASSVGLREDSTATLLGDALELSQRLPRVWKQFHDEGLPAYKARRVAWHTKKLSPTAAAHVDRMVTPSVASMPLSRIKYFVEEARELYDTTGEPEVGSDWGITSAPNMEVTNPDGSQEICLRADKPDLDQFTHTLGRLTDLLAVRGDSRCRGARASTALGLLSNPKTALAWLQNPAGVPAARGTCGARSGSNDHSGAAGMTGATDIGQASSATRGENTARARVFGPAGVRSGVGVASGEVTVGVTRALDVTHSVGTPNAAGNADVASANAHTNTTETTGATNATIAAAADSTVLEPTFAGQTYGGLVQLVLHAQATGNGPVRVQGPKGGNLGLVAPEVVDRWLARFTGKLTVTPVIDHDAWFQVEGYQPPPRLREHVQQRDQTCVFPDCTVPAVRCDVDHILPYPQGSTVTTNLAALCRHHHRIKTHHGWSYQRLPDGAYLWHSPDGQRALRDPTTGTTHLPPLPPPRTRNRQ